jgi:hypothetical protein
MKSVFVKGDYVNINVKPYDPKINYRVVDIRLWSRQDYMLVLVPDTEYHDQSVNDEVLLPSASVTFKCNKDCFLF